MKKLIVIPARGGSKGIPGKNIYPINGKPLLAYTIETLIAEKLQTIGHDVGKNQISQLELGSRFVNDIELKALSEIFHVSVGELLNEDIYMMENEKLAFVADVEADKL